MAAMRVGALLGAEPAAGQRRRHSPRALASPSALQQQRGLGVPSLGAPAGAGPASPPHPCPAVPVRCSLRSKEPPPTTLAAVVAAVARAAAAAVARAAAAALARVPAAAMAFAAPEEIPTARAAPPAVPRSGSSQRRHRVPQPDCHTPPAFSLAEPTAARKTKGRNDCGRAAPRDFGRDPALALDLLLQRRELPPLRRNRRPDSPHPHVIQPRRALPGACLRLGCGCCLLGGPARSVRLLLPLLVALADFLARTLCSLSSLVLLRLRLCPTMIGAPAPSHQRRRTLRLRGRRDRCRCLCLCRLRCFGLALFRCRGGLRRLLQLLLQRVDLRCATQILNSQPTPKK